MVTKTLSLIQTV